MRILGVLLPHFAWRCEIWRRPEIAGRSAIVLQSKDAGGSSKLVLDYSPELEGLQCGLSLQQALSRYGEVELIQADIPHYWSVFDDLLDSLELKSPLVEGAELGCAYVGLDGLQSIYPDDGILIKEVREVISKNFDPRLGIAGGKFPAYLAALYSPPGGCRILTGDVGDFLSGLSCEVLPVSLKSRNKLRNFGLRTLGQVAALPPGPLQSQFGPEGRKIRELAAGFDDTPLYPRLTREVIEESAVLSSITVSLEALLVNWEALLSRVFMKLAPRGMGLRSLALWTRSWKSEYWEQPLRFKEPAMDIRSTISRIKLLLEGFPQPGPVERLGLKITGLGRRHGHQRSLFSEVRDQDHLMDDIRQLETRMGGPQIFRIKEVEPWSRIPERRYALTPAFGG